MKGYQNYAFRRDGIYPLFEIPSRLSRSLLSSWQIFWDEMQISRHHTNCVSVQLHLYDACVSHGCTFFGFITINFTRKRTDSNQSQHPITGCFISVVLIEISLPSEYNYHIICFSVVRIVKPHNSQYRKVISIFNQDDWLETPCKWPLVNKLSC